MHPFTDVAMGHATIFVLFYCVVFYFAHSSLSKPLNYEEEINKVFGITNREQTSKEKAMAYKIIHERETAQKERDEKIRAQCEKEESVKYELILATRNRVDNLERMFCTGTELVLPKNMARVERWQKISKLRTPLVSAFLDTLRNKGVNDNQFPLIWETISQLCQYYTNQRAAHSNIPLPDASEKSILSALEITGIIADGVVVTTYKILIEPLPSPFMEKFKKFENDNESEIRDSPGKPEQNDVPK